MRDGGHTAHRADTNKDTGAHASERYDRRLVPLLAFLGVMAYALAMAVVTPALPLIQHDMRTTAGGAAWALTATTLSAAVSTPLVGRLGDLFGARRMLLAVLVVTIIGMLIAALAGSLPMLLAGRAISGIGAGVFPLAYTIIRDTMPAHRMAPAIGVMSAMLGLGGALGWVIAGPIIDQLGWRWLLWVPVAALVPAVPVAWRLVPAAPPRPQGGIDWWGAALFTCWMAGALTALTQGPSWGWTSTRVLGLLAGSAALAVCWCLVESRTAEPLVDLRVMRRRGVWTANAASLLSGYALMAGGILFPLLVQLPAGTGHGFGGSATQAAMLQLPASAAMTVTGLAAGLLHRLVGSRTVLIGGALLTGGGYAFVAVAHSAMWELYVGGVLRGAGLGLAYAAVANLVIAAVPPDQTGAATGVNTLIRTVGASLGTQASAAIISASVVTGTGLPAEHGFTAGFAVAGLMMAGVLVVAAIIPRAPEHRADHPAEPKHRASATVIGGSSSNGPGVMTGAPVGGVRTIRRRGAPRDRARPSR